MSEGFAIFPLERGHSVQQAVYTLVFPSKTAAPGARCSAPEPKNLTVPEDPWPSELRKPPSRRIRNPVKPKYQPLGRFGAPVGALENSPGQGTLKA
jgi:hypothetical protein